MKDTDDKMKLLSFANIQYSLFNDGGANWILAVGYLHISTFNKKGRPHETLRTNPRFIPRALNVK